MHQRLIERLRQIKDWSPEEARAYNSLSPNKMKQYDRRVHRWLYCEIDGPIPLIPGTEARACPSSDANCTIARPHSEA